MEEDVHPQGQTNIRSIRSRRFRALTLAVLAVALAGSLVVMGCGGDDDSESGDSSAGSGAPYELSVSLDWQPSSQHMGLYRALEDGLYEEENLDVSFEIPSDATAPLRFVGTDKVDLAISYQPEVMIGAAEGLPVTAVAAIVPTALASFVAMPESGITSPADLSGKKIGYSGIPKEEGMIRSILEDQGISEDDVELINVGFNLVPAALNGEIDAMVGAFRNGTAVELAERTGEEPVVTPVDEIGVPPYNELVLVANSERLESDEEYADAVARFISASVEGTEAAVEDRDATVEAMKNAVDGAIPDSQVEAELDATYDLMLPTDGRSPGCFDMAAWDEFATWVEENELANGDIPAGEELVTNEYVPGCEDA